MYKSTVRDWPEDYTTGENRYECSCIDCGYTFYGYKRRKSCKICSGVGMPPTRIDFLKKSEQPASATLDLLLAVESLQSARTRFFENNRLAVKESKRELHLWKSAYFPSDAKSLPKGWIWFPRGDK